MLTKSDIATLKRELATKEDLENLATREELKQLATKEDLKKLATKRHLARLEEKIDGVLEFAYKIEEVRHKDQKRLKEIEVKLGLSSS